MIFRKTGSPPSDQVQGQAFPDHALKVEPKRRGFSVNHNSTADIFDSRDHASIAAEQSVGKRNNPHIGRSGRRCAPQRLRDVRLIALRTECADRCIGARGRPADPHKAVHHQRRAAIPACARSGSGRRPAPRRAGYGRRAVSKCRAAAAISDFPAVTCAGRIRLASSPISDTTWRAPVSSTVSCRRASEQT
jgi:hypothetical protein